MILSVIIDRAPFVVSTKDTYSDLSKMCMHLQVMCITPNVNYLWPVRGVERVPRVKLLIYCRSEH